MGLAEVRRAAGIELNALRRADVLPEEVFERAKIAAKGTEVYDVNGKLLYRRLPLARGKKRVAFADVAEHEEIGGPLLSVSAGGDWNEAALLKEASAAARKLSRGLTWDQARFVAFSYPKLAVQFLKDGQEVLMLECWTWREVPKAPAHQERKYLEPGNFERWSLLDELPQAVRRERARDLRKRVDVYASPLLRGLDLNVVSKTLLSNPIVALKLVDTRELHYSKRNTDHQTCYELRGQQTNVWCVGASTEMLLNFYRYEYNQVRLAQELGLGTLNNPNGLPYANVGKVVTVIEKLASQNLDATMVTNPNFDFFKTEVIANRPTISFVPGHSRTVAGYTRTLMLMPGELAFRGLLVYDPWPPNAGVITRWENFDTQTYQYGYSAVLKHV